MPHGSDIGRYSGEVRLRDGSLPRAATNGYRSDLGQRCLGTCACLTLDGDPARVENFELTAGFGIRRSFYWNLRRNSFLILKVGNVYARARASGHGLGDVLTKFDESF